MKLLDLRSTWLRDVLLSDTSVTDLFFFSGERSRDTFVACASLSARGRSGRGGAMPVSFAGAPMDLTMLIENSSRELLAAVDGAPASPASLWDALTRARAHARTHASGFAHAVCIRAPDIAPCTIVCVSTRMLHRCWCRLSVPHHDPFAPRYTRDSSATG